MHTMTTTKNVKPNWEKKMQLKRDKLAMKVCSWFVTVEFRFSLE